VSEPTFVEILGRHGEVLTRHAAAAFPVAIGRAYDNDVIVDDPYVAPHHLRIERTDAGALEIVDLGTRNGLAKVGSRGRTGRATIDPAARYRIGHTELRVRPADFPVAPERADPGHGRLAHPATATLLAVAAAASVVALAWSLTFERTEPLKLLLPALWVAIGLVAWAGVWALAGRLWLGEARFGAHLATAGAAVIGVFAVGVGTEYAAFAFSLGGLDLVEMLAVAALVGFALHQHLRLASRHPGRAIRVAAAALGLAFAASIWLAEYAEDLGDRGRMRFLKEVKRPEVRLARGVKVEDFLDAAARMEQRLAQMREAP
jgi:hypothetical protein